MGNGLDSDTDGNFEKALTFKVLCEFLKTQGPVEPGGIIDTIPLDMGLSEAGPSSILHFSAPLGEHAMDGFEVVDDPLAKTARPSNWQFNSDMQRFEQLKRIRGGQKPATSPNKAGTYLLLKNGLDQIQNDHLAITTTVCSEVKGGIGLVFKWQDVDNYYFFLMDSRYNYRLIAKKLDGVFAFLDTTAVDAKEGYTVGDNHDIKVVVRGTKLTVYLNNKLILLGEDNSIVAAGRIGLMSRDNKKACFYKLGWEIL